MSEALLIYGATGYSGRLAAREALARGLRPLLGGRDPARLAALGAELGLPWRTASLDAGDQLDALLADVRVVLHAAGPFSTTSRPMLEACLRHGAHYLDITGEVGAIEAVRVRSEAARARGCMLMPAVGFDVVASDCLAVRVAARLAGAMRLRIGITGLDFATRASARTLVEHAGRTVLVRRGGRLTRVTPGSLERAFDFGAGPRACLAVSWGDVAAAYYSTGIPDIEVYFEATPRLRALMAAERAIGPLLRTAPWQALLKAGAALLPEGPSEAERASHRMSVVAEAEDAAGRRACARLETPEAYSFTAMAAIEIARRVLVGDFEPGFQTPGRLYGADFVLGWPSVERVEWEETT